MGDIAEFAAGRSSEPRRQAQGRPHPARQPRAVPGLRPGHRREPQGLLVLVARGPGLRLRDLEEQGRQDAAAAVARELIATGRTAKPVTGFKGRSGRRSAPARARAERGRQVARRVRRAVGARGRQAARGRRGAGAARPRRRPPRRRPRRPEQATPRPRARGVGRRARSPAAPGSRVRASRPETGADAPQPRRERRPSAGTELADDRR